MAILNAQTVSRLKAQLLTSGLQQKDQPLFQVINLLIDSMSGLGQNIELITGGGGGGGGLANADYVTHENNQATLPNSRLITAGSGVTLHKTSSQLLVGSSPIPWDNDRDSNEFPLMIPGPQGPIGANGLMGPMGIDGLCCEGIESTFPPGFGIISNPILIPYTPVWTGTTTNPTLGNGTLTGGYYKFDKLIFYNIDLTIGATTTVATGAWFFTVPSNINVVNASYVELINFGVALFLGVAAAALANSVQIYHGTPTNNVSDLSPFIWGATDILRIRGIYIEV